ncbi:hypothetical protein V6N12_056640 [Hibiscus sabdariffa]|uniref:Uncharacterized protein n=1 Tax=Hibiscus sabdariffa TaxID=183260 RepID=A0ABR2CT36_9ROSI
MAADGRIYISRHVKFAETSFPFAVESTSKPQAAAYQSSKFPQVRVHNDISADGVDTQPSAPEQCVSTNAQSASAQRIDTSLSHASEDISGSVQHESNVHGSHVMPEVALPMSESSQGESQTCFMDPRADSSAQLFEEAAGSDRTGPAVSEFGQTSQENQERKTRVNIKESTSKPLAVGRFQELRRQMNVVPEQQIRRGRPE